MSAVSVAEMLEAEQAAIAAGWTEAALMQLAGDSLGHAIGRHFPKPGTAIGYIGKGHNAGDTFIALHILKQHYRWTIAYRNAWPLEQCASLTQQHVGGIQPWMPTATPNDGSPLLLLDGLVGTGARGPLRTPLLELAEEMARLRRHHGAHIAAIDIPSGLDADTGEATIGAVTADITFMIGNAKIGLIRESAASHTGALALIPVEPLRRSGKQQGDLFCPQTHPLETRRPHTLHKTSAGRVQILAGSTTYPGAAVIAAIGALRSGAGMVILDVPQSIHSLVCSKCPPEVIVRPYDRIRSIVDPAARSRVVGCGLGPLDDAAAFELFEWISKSELPTVIDADALNSIAAHGQLRRLSHRHVITPHPGEFERLMPGASSLARGQAHAQFRTQHPCTLLLKGTRTLVGSSSHGPWSNPTGNSGMACAGQGDLLAGVIGSQLAAGHEPCNAAALGAWLCGRAAELAIWQGPHSEESLTPSICADYLGSAFTDWRCAGR